MPAGQTQQRLTATIMLVAGFGQASNPMETLAELYEQVPERGHIALDFGRRVRQLLRATAVGLARV